MFSSKPLRFPARALTPDLVITEPPPNPCADDKIVEEGLVFKRLLAQRLRLVDDPQHRVDLEGGLRTAEAAAEYAWARFAWTKRHLWVEALRAGKVRPARNPEGIMGEALCEILLDQWAVEGGVLKVPKGFVVLTRAPTPGSESDSSGSSADDARHSG